MAIAYPDGGTASTAATMTVEILDVWVYVDATYAAPAPRPDLPVDALAEKEQPLRDDADEHRRALRATIDGLAGDHERQGRLRLQAGRKSRIADPGWLAVRRRTGLKG